MLSKKFGIGGVRYLCIVIWIGGWAKHSVSKSQRHKERLN